MCLILSADCFSVFRHKKYNLCFEHWWSNWRCVCSGCLLCAWAVCSPRLEAGCAWAVSVSAVCAWAVCASRLEAGCAWVGCAYRPSGSPRSPLPPLPLSSPPPSPSHPPFNEAVFRLCGVAMSNLGGFREPPGQNNMTPERQNVAFLVAQGLYHSHKTRFGGPPLKPHLPWPSPAPR